MISDITSNMEVIFIPRRKDITGQVFDQLTVIEMLWNYENKHRTYCRCIGIDGKEYIVRQDALISGATHSIHGACSGGIKHDISNQRFGRLVAIEPTSLRASNGGVRWKCLCDCGKIVYPTMNNLIRGHTTSCGCVKEDYLESCKLDIIGKQFGKLKIIEDIFNPNYNRRMVICLCECGNTHVCSVSDLTTGHTSSCGCEHKSKGESFIEDLLKQYNIHYIRQKRFDDCRNKKTLPFDFYIPIINTCIEYDGEQHFSPIEHWGGEEMFKIRQQNDKIKTEYCKEKGINLIRISYKQSKSEISEIINNLIRPATITA